MNERIKYIDDKRVEIVVNRAGYVISITLSVYEDEWNETRGSLTVAWDEQGRAALRECINCFEATGSFAALLDTSAVPFSGKQVRDESGDTVTLAWSPKVPAKAAERWVYYDAEGAMGCVPTTDLRPLTPPAPEYRPYTPVEAIQHLSPGAQLHHAHNRQGCAVSGIEWMVDKFNIRMANLAWITLPELFNQYVHVDGTPCGMKVEATQ